MIVFSLAITIILYIGAKWCYGRNPRVYLSPLVTTPILIIALLIVGHIPYDNYSEGAQWLSSLLQPATIAFAVPLYKYRVILKKHALQIIVSVFFGSIVAIVSSALIAEELHVNMQIVDSLVSRSVTTPIAMDISQMIGGVPAITAVFVILTGLLGSLLGPLVIRLCKIDNEIARGVLYGTSAHVVGTTKAFELSSTTGTISSLSMILAAIITVCAAPLLVPMFQF